MTDSELKICRNCRYFRADAVDTAEKSECHHPSSKMINPVTGDESFKTCRLMRKSAFSAILDTLYCGPLGSKFAEAVGEED